MEKRWCHWYPNRKCVAMMVLHTIDTALLAIEKTAFHYLGLQIMEQKATLLKRSINLEKRNIQNLPDVKHLGYEQGPARLAHKPWTNCNKWLYRRISFVTVNQTIVTKTVHSCLCWPVIYCWLWSWGSSFF